MYIVSIILLFIIKLKFPPHESLKYDGLPPWCRGYATKRHGWVSMIHNHEFVVYKFRGQAAVVF